MISKKSDQTARMSRLIFLFAGRSSLMVDHVLSCAGSFSFFYMKMYGYSEAPCQYASNE